MDTQPVVVGFVVGLAVVATAAAAYAIFRVATLENRIIAHDALGAEWETAKATLAGYLGRLDKHAARLTARRRQEQNESPDRGEEQQTPVESVQPTASAAPPPAPGSRLLLLASMRR